MDKSKLTDALTAGISGKTGDSDLGLFGMQMEKLLKVKHIKMVG